jgi:hypothetical protein
MKTAKEWFEEELSGEPLTQESVIEVLERVQKEAWNEALDKAAESADVTDLGIEGNAVVDLNSILKLKL